MREGGIKEGGTTEATGVLWEHCLGLIRWASVVVRQGKLGPAGRGDQAVHDSVFARASCQEQTESLAG